MPVTNYNLHLKGYVGGEDFDSGYVDYVLAKNADNPVSVLVDSLGGSLSTALSISAAFKNHGDVSVHFVGMNASAATIASMGAKHISIDANAMYLVHKCSAEFFEFGAFNADSVQQLINDLEARKADLDKLDVNIASMYSARCRRDAKDLLALMRAGGWLSAKEALEWGFVDEITNLDEQAPVLTDAVASAMASAGIPVPNLPLKESNTAFARFINSLSALFKSEKSAKSDNPSELMDMTFLNIGKILETEKFTAVDAKIAFDLDAVNRIEVALALKDKLIEELNARIKTLESAPADSTSNVINNQIQSPDAAAPKSELELYVETLNSARELYDLV